MGGRGICFVLNSLGAGGTERSVADLLPPLRDRGWEPMVAVLAAAPEGLEAEVQAGGFEVARLPSGRPRAVAALRRLIRARRPALVHTAIFDADVAGRLAAAGTGVPVVTSLINCAYDPARREDPNVRPAVLAAYRAVDAWTARHLTAHFHAVTEGVKQAAVRDLGIDPARVTVVHRGRDRTRLGEWSPERRSAARRRLGIPPDAPVVLAAGRQEYQKGHVDLVAAAAVLAAHHPDLVVLIAGRRGHATCAIEAAVRRSGTGAHVRLLGHRDDIGDLLAAADVVALPSRYEGTAGIVIEAMAMARPVVASDLAALHDVVERDVTGLLVPPADPPALAAAIGRVLADPGLAAALGRAGRAAFEARFTLEASVAGMVGLYERVAAASPAGR